MNMSAAANAMKRGEYVRLPTWAKGEYITRDADGNIHCEKLRPYPLRVDELLSRKWEQQP